MLGNSSLPQELVSALGSENQDFAVKAGRAEPLKKSLSLIAFGMVWLAFTSVFVIAFLGPLFLGNEVHFETNGVPTVASRDNLGPIMIPALVIGIFITIGIGMLSGGIYKTLKKGGYFIGTPLRLIQYRKGNLRSIDWEQFSGDIEVSGDEQKGNIALRLRSGKMVSQKNGPDRYVPDIIYISDIPNAFEVEQSCRKRIKENDPTPTN
ncbi:MAG: hypothetical protein P1P90_02810 [Patescibacteria group bacterium]|nr:hypothetical protein [Patescibacteria group bacterium]